MDLAGVINGALVNNSIGNDIEPDADDDRLVLKRERRPTPSAPSASSESPNTGTSCERCVRGKRACTGVPGVRCGYCKHLKQKCTNSSGTARGKNAAAKKVTQPAAPPPSKPSGASSSVRRKQPVKDPVKDLGPVNGDADATSQEDDGSPIDEEAHKLPPRLNKKRRISMSSKGKGPSRSELRKLVGDLDASVKRFQSTVTRELDKVNGTIKALNAMISEMDSD